MRFRGPANRLAAVLAAAVAIGGGILPGAAQEPASTSFVLSQSTLSGGAGAAVSSSFVLDGSAGQPTTVGSTVSTSFVIESGFWNSLSAQLVLTAAGSGSGRGTLSGPGFACTADAGTGIGDCSESFVRGTMLGLVAAPDPANAFDGWSGCDSTSTTTLAGDTCTVAMNASRTVTAAFTSLAIAGDRVWMDVNGDGVQDGGEPGLDGVTVILKQGGSVEATAVTSGGGLYRFEDLYPGTYTIAVDPLTLPTDYQPSFDVDGLGTPSTAEVTVVDGQLRADVDFGYQPLVDLVITKDDSEDPLPGGDTLIYTITVTNLGVNDATGVTVTDILPGATSLVATTGCLEDPAGAPVCTLGAIPPGGVSSYTLAASIDPAPPAQISNTATVASIEGEKSPADNEATQNTDLDADPPEITLVSRRPSSGGDTIAECSTMFGGEMRHLAVSFDEAMNDPSGDDRTGDVTNPDSWLLVTPGPDATLQTTDCGTVAGDDVQVPLSVTYDAVGQVATLSTSTGSSLAGTRYRLIACGTGSSVLTDLAGNPLDGDGDGFSSDDFTVAFRNDPANALANGHFDCGLAPWSPMSTNPAEISAVSDDVDGSADSGAVRFENLAAGRDFELAQCAPVVGGGEYSLAASVLMDTGAFGIGTEVGCRFYETPDCSGATVGGLVSSSVLLGDTGGSWVEVGDDIVAPEGAASATCFAAFATVTDDAFAATVDRIEVAAGIEPEPVFSDGFESGSTSAWSAGIGEFE
jgi:uncharacterized repeat protein (TIGR01451 family)